MADDDNSGVLKDLLAYLKGERKMPVYLVTPCGCGERVCAVTSICTEAFPQEASLQLLQRRPILEGSNSMCWIVSSSSIQEKP